MTEPSPPRMKLVGPSPSPNGRVSDFLSYLVFQAEHVRIGLEITACVFLYYLVYGIVPWNLLNVSPEWISLFSWFIACLALVWCDQVFLCRPLHIFKKARHMDIDGAYESALHVLEKIGPKSKTWIRFPMPKYHLERTRIFAHAERFVEAEEELELAKQAGLNDAEYRLARCIIHKAKDEVDKAVSELKELHNLIGTNPSLLAEEGILLMHQRRDYREARKLLTQALQDPKVYYLERGTLSLIITGYFEVTRLWTGEAEEGLDGLTQAIDQLQAISMYDREYRPYLACLLLERAYYLVTHRQPERGIRDTGLANSLCAYPHIRRRTADVSEELNHRYNIKLEPC